MPIVTAHGLGNALSPHKVPWLTSRRNTVSLAMTYSRSESQIVTALWDHAGSKLEKAYCPYSEFPVVAAIMMADGSIYSGCNIENSSFSLTLCAESNAISQAICDKHQLITDVLVHAPKMPYCPPCGACRQKLSEFTNPDTAIYLANSQTDYRCILMKDLLPFSFKLEDNINC